MLLRFVFVTLHSIAEELYCIVYFPPMPLIISSVSLMLSDGAEHLGFA